MNIMTSAVKLFGQTLLIIVIIEVCGKAFFKHTLIGRFIYRICKDTFKTIKWAIKGCLKILEFLVVKSKVIYKNLTEAINDYMEKRETMLSTHNIEGDTKIINLANYLNKHKIG